jgi:hypothetical protein
MIARILPAALLLVPAMARVEAQGNPSPDPSSVLFSKSDKKRAETIRMVQGTVKDMAENPLEKAIVELKDLKTSKVRSFITRQDGTYHFDDLSRSVDYELRAIHHGVTTPYKKVSNFDSRKKIYVNFQVEAKQ